jgi:CRP-like cAMP-binding protein
MNRLESFKTLPKQVIFKKGDPSDYFYIIIHGTIQISDIAEDKVKTISRGTYFGDIGIYSKATRSATATSVTTTHLLGLKKENFLRISLELSKRAQAEVFSYIKNIPMFKNLNLQQKHKIAYLAQELKFKTHAVIFKKG